MSAVLQITGTLSLNAIFNLSLAAGVGFTQAQTIVGAIQSQFTYIGNATGAALDIDLIAAGQLTLAATSQLLDFSAINDPGNTSRNWTGGRIRFLGVQTVTTTSGFDIEVYADATNGISWLPPVANTLKAYANGGVLMFSDPNSNGASVGQCITSTSKRMDLNSGANTVVVTYLAVGSSVA